MSCVHYKFFSKLSYDTVTFNGLHISLCDLKCQIMAREKLKACNCDLQITNAQTKEEYADGNALIPRNSSVIVRRIPPGGVKATSKTYVSSETKPVSRTSKAIDDSSASINLTQLIKNTNLAKANTSEEDKIKVMMIQSCCEYSPVNYTKKPLRPPPPSYTCFCCGKSGHRIKNCPTNGDKTFEPAARIKKSTGIPMSFLMEVKDPNAKGVLLTKNGKYTIPIISAEAYARGKKEKPPFWPEEPSSSSVSHVPDELLCLICEDIMTDAAVTVCCGKSFCDECIRTALLESEEHICPVCHQTDVSPDALVANQFLRQAVNNFKNGTGTTKRLFEQIQEQEQQQPPPPPPPPRTVIPPAALVTAAEHSKSFSLSVSSLLEEKGYQVPVQRQLALPSLLGPHGQSIPITCRPLRDRTIRSAGGRPGWERSKTPSSASSYSRSSDTYCKSRSGSSHARYCSQSFSLSYSCYYSRSPPCPRKGKGKSRNYHSRSRSPGYHHSKSRSPPYRRYHSRSRSSGFRGQSPTKRTIPLGEAEKEYFNSYREVPPYDMKAYYGRSVDFRDPFEKERYRERERNYRARYEKFCKDAAVGIHPPRAVNRENFAPDRCGLPGTRQENSPYARGRREDYPGGRGHQNCNTAGNYSENRSGRESHGIKDPTKSKEKKVENPLGDGKGNKHKKHRKRRKEDENEGFPNAALLEGERKPREPVTAQDLKPDSLFMLPRRDDATPLRDEPMEAYFIPFKMVSEKEEKEKIKPEAKMDKTKWKVEVASPLKKDNILKPAKASQRKAGTDHAKSPGMEPPVKKVKK